MDSLATVKITYASADTKDLVLTLRKAFNLVPSSHVHKRIPFQRFPTAGTNLAGYKPVVSVSPISFIPSSVVSPTAGSGKRYSTEADQGGSRGIFLRSVPHASPFYMRRNGGLQNPL